MCTNKSTGKNMCTNKPSTRVQVKTCVQMILLILSELYWYTSVLYVKVDTISVWLYWYTCTSVLSVKVDNVSVWLYWFII